MKRIVLSVAALSALVAAGIALVGAAPASAAYRVGLGEQNPEMFDSPAWQSLKLKRVRYLVPWDYADHQDQRSAFDQYMLRARAARQDVLVTFTARRGCYLPSGRYSKARVCRAPSASEYRNAFGMFDAKFPWVKTYSAWNEINHKSQPTFKSPRTAAGYYNVLRAQARRGKFRVMAADMLDTPNMSRYLAASGATPTARRSCGACTTTATSTAAARPSRRRCCAPSPARSG